MTTDTVSIWRRLILGLAVLSGVAVSVASPSAEAQRRRTSSSAATPSAATPSAATPSALRGANVEAAVAAANALGISKGKASKAVGELLGALAMGLHPQVAIASLNSLALRADDTSFDVVAFYLRHRNTNVRIAARKAMASLRDKRVQALLLAGLSDGNRSVRAAAAQLLAAKKVSTAVVPLVGLLRKGDKAAAPALALLATPDVAASLVDSIGKAPDGLLARCLGAILLRPDFKPEEARVDVVQTLGKIPGSDSLEQLTNYIAAIPETPPRESRKEAESIVEARMGGL